MSILTEEEIAKDLKRRKITKDLLPWAIRGYIIEALEDSEDSAFRTGKEEGRAELQDEIDSREEFVEFEDPDYSHTLFAIDLLKDVDSLEKLNEVRQWLALQECRSMPVNTPTGVLFNHWGY